MYNYGTVQCTLYRVNTEDFTNKSLENRNYCFYIKITYKHATNGDSLEITCTVPLKAGQLGGAAGLGVRST